MDAEVLSETPIPLVLDLDGTLIRTDCFFEGLVKLIKVQPFTAAFIFLAMVLGFRAKGKKWLFSRVTLDPKLLPYNEEVLEFAKREASIGRPIIMATAAAKKTADAVATHLGFIDEVFATEGKNLKGQAKANLLAKQFPSGFDYVGDSTADKPVWERSRQKLFAGGSASGLRAFQSVQKPDAGTFRTPGTSLKLLLKQLRIHQWSKNLLMFVPLVLNHQFALVGPWISVLAGFFIFSLFASATYIINDLLDLDADRRHRTKKYRPLASGQLKISSGLSISAGLLVFGLVCGAILDADFAALMCVYLVFTLTYSTVLKRVPFLDCVMLGGLFTLRVVMGSALSDIVMTIWLLLFSSTIFFGLTVAKRYAEIQRHNGKPGTKPDELIPGRGFYGEDAPLVLAFGVSSTLASILVFVLYLVENAFETALYAEENWLWVIVVLIVLWVIRIWTLAHRRVLADDPVSFAIKDRISWAIGLAAAIAFCLAKFGTAGLAFG